MNSQSLIDTSQSAGYFVRKDCSIIELKGEHSGRYLQSRLSNDVLRLQASESCLSACLDAQGKLEALFTVFCVEPAAHYLCISDGGSPSKAKEDLLRFKVAERFTAELLENLNVVHIFSLDRDELMSILSGVSPLHSVPSRRLCAPGFDLIFKNSEIPSSVEKVSKILPEISTSDLKILRIIGHRPWLPEELSPGSLFLETPYLDAISSQKGCYPGQEVIEKALARGKPPRLLLAFRNEDMAPLAGEKVVTATEKSPVGEVVVSEFDEQSKNGYAFLRIKSGFRSEQLTTESGSLLLELPTPPQ